MFNEGQCRWIVYADVNKNVIRYEQPIISQQEQGIFGIVYELISRFLQPLL